MYLKGIHLSDCMLEPELKKYELQKESIYDYN